MQPNLREKIKEFPMSPGVYQFIDSNGDILYVGKAKNLKSRIKSYFLKDIGRGPSIDIMVEAAFDIKYIVTESEIEAVLLEAELINKLQPKYNARLKDDKSFLVIKITKPGTVIPTPQPCLRVEESSNSRSLHFGRDDNKEDENKKSLKNIEREKFDQYSCVELVRARNVDFTDKSAEYFGPYPAGLLLKKSLNYLRKIFPFRDCSKAKFATYQKKGRTCIYGDIGICTGPCVDLVTPGQYQKNITYFKNFLLGKKKKIIVDLEKEMNKFSKKNKFEQAARIRDQLMALDHLKNVAIGLRDDVFSSSNILFKRIECYDISNIGGKYAVGSMVVFSEGKKSTDDYRHFKIKNYIIPATSSVIPTEVEESINKISPTVARGRNDIRGGNDLAMMKEMLERRFKNNWPMPDLIVIDGGTNHLRIALEVLESRDLDIPVISIAKGAKRDKNEFHYSNSIVAKYIKTSTEVQNIIIASRDEAHRFAINYYRKLHKKDMFE